jgi:hypothetical protein
MAARRYESYLLRVWESDQAGELIWRASLESTDTGERHGFADLDSLFAYLETVCQTLPPDDVKRADSVFIALVINRQRASQ